MAGNADWASIINGILVGAGSILSTYNKGGRNVSTLTIDPVTGQYYASNVNPYLNSGSGLGLGLSGINPLIWLAVIVGAVYLIFRRKK